MVLCDRAGFQMNSHAKPPKFITFFFLLFRHPNPELSLKRPVHRRDKPVDDPDCCRFLHESAANTAISVLAAVTSGRLQVTPL